MSQKNKDYIEEIKMDNIEKEIENLHNSAEEHVAQAHRFARDSFDSSAAQELRYAGHDRQVAEWLSQLKIIQDAYNICNTPEEVYDILGEVFPGNEE
jgi:formate-dependent nitrite reductase cytochrome c552 subunit